MTDRDLSKFYRVSEKTLYNWKNGDEALRRRYDAMKLFYTFWAGSLEEKIKIFANFLKEKK